MPVEGTNPSESCRIPKLNSFTILEFRICTQFADQPCGVAGKGMLLPGQTREDSQ